MSAPSGPPGSRSRVSWRSTCATARASRSRPANTTSEPALDPDPGGQPAPQVHARSSSRWKIATGPRSCSRSHVRERLGDDDRAVEAAGAADGDGQPGLALPDVGRDGEAEEFLEEGQEALGHGLAKDVLPHRLKQSPSAASPPDSSSCYIVLLCSVILRRVSSPDEIEPAHAAPPEFCPFVSPKAGCVQGKRPRRRELLSSA